MSYLILLKYSSDLKISEKKTEGGKKENEEKGKNHTWNETAVIS
jgi:hypothetical protein